MSDRYPDATLALDQTPPPAVVKDVDYESIRSDRLTDFAARLKALSGVDYNVEAIEGDPGVVLQEEGAYREILCRAAINDAAKAVMILYARGTDQDNLYPLVGIRRLTITPADPATGTPAAMEGDDDFRARAVIALEGTAPGLTGGGYAHIALRASAEVRRVSLQRAPGGVVNVVLQGRINADGGVSAAAVQAVAAALNDDWSDDPGTGSQLTDVPQVTSAVPKAYDIHARALVPSGPTKAAVQAQSTKGLAAAAASLQLIGNTVPLDALIAAGRVASMSKFWFVSPPADVVATEAENPWARTILVEVLTPGEAKLAGWAIPGD